MPFIKTTEQYSSVSFVGMAKNSGKTTCLNYVVARLRERRKIALTSIGVDGEERDILYDTPKPRIVLHDGMVFITSEKDFANREFSAEILSVSERVTPLGRLITARAKGSGKVVLSGPSDSLWLKESMANMKNYGVKLTLVDGALSRMSFASPAITDAMILCTGAVLSKQLSQVIHKTKYTCRMINLEEADSCRKEELSSLGRGIWLFDEGLGAWKEVAESVFTLDKGIERWLFEKTDTLFAGGAVTNPFLSMLSVNRKTPFELIVRDFTKLFVEQSTFDKFTRCGGRIKVLHKPKLIAVITNPVSPEGVRMDPVLLREQMEDALQVPVYDVVNF